MSTSLLEFDIVLKPETNFTLESCRPMPLCAREAYTEHLYRVSVAPWGSIQIQKKSKQLEQKIIIIIQKIIINYKKQIIIIIIKNKKIKK